VFGASGAGKSVFMNMLITTAMLANHTRGRLMIVDFAGETKSSYLMIAKLFGGKFVPILSQESGLAINPFPPRRMATKNSEVLGEVLSFLSVLTDMLIVNTGDDKDAQLHRNIVQKAIVEAYDKSDDPEYAPTFSDLFRILKGYEKQKEVDRERLAMILSLLEGFLRSPEAALFNRRSSVRIDSDFLIFDLFGIDSLPPQIQQAVAYLVCHYVKGLAFDANDPGIKYVVLDEVAQLLRRKEMTALVHELYSTARKHNTSIWTVTQKYTDYIASAVAGTINLNSTSQLFLSHARAAPVRRQIAEDFELNEREQYLFETLRTKKGEFSEALLRTEIWDEARSEKRGISAKLKVELSPFDYEITTSDAKDRELQRRFTEANPHLSLAEILQEIARRKAAVKGARK
jgi:type IV secretory pathway VirB4 component